VAQHFLLPGRVKGEIARHHPTGIVQGVDRPIPTVMRPNHFIYVRDEAPDDFAYAVAKALDERRQLFRYSSNLVLRS
jgi:hypothetical protein